ncbi:MAG: type I restriction enzyme HsdR N-terminal domain-containing protein [Cytophagaceae bacterium]|nr:type I restriction enzyme HsdR N-terminal domain-containing protein [Cytophagaceae bacterium]
MFPPLTLPAFECKLTEIAGKPHIYCLVRRKHLVLTPEEWVRQHFINLLSTRYEYPLALMRIEGGLRLNRLAKRTDLVVYDREGRPFLVLECKAPTVRLTPAVLEQAARYNHVLQAPYLAVSNGMDHFCFQVSAEGLKRMGDLPIFL